MKKTQVSVIVPVYNTEKYLLKCYDSIVNSAINLDFEIIFINDGSTDDSPNIINALAKSDDKIKIINQTNQGLSAARNTGIDAASSEFVLFLDSDDCISMKYIHNLYDLAKENQLDLISFGSVHQLHSIEHRLEEAIGIIPEKVSNIESGKDVLRKGFALTSACLYLYNLAFLKENKLYFTKDIVLEDIEFCMRLMLKVNRISFTDLPVYYYYISRPGSITNSGIIEKKQKYISDCIKVAKLVKENISSEYDNALNDAIQQSSNSIIFDVLWRFYKNKTEFSKEFKEESFKQMNSFGLFPLIGATRGKMQMIAKLLGKSNFLFKKIIY